MVLEKKMRNHIEIITHRQPSECYIEPSPMNDGMYIIYQIDYRDTLGKYFLTYLGHVSIYGLGDFLSEFYPTK
jgi:hypothetical protein